MKTKLMLFSAAVALISVVGCSSAGKTREEGRVATVTTTVDRDQAQAREDELTNTLAAELEGWDERISELKSRSLQTRNHDRFKLLSENIADLEKQARDARENFIELRTAETDGSREKYKEKINSNLDEMRKVYNNLPAE